MKKYRAIQKITKGDRVFMPGEFIDDVGFTDKQLKKYENTGFAILKDVKEKPKKQKKVNDVK